MGDKRSIAETGPVAWLEKRSEFPISFDFHSQAEVTGVDDESIDSSLRSTSRSSALGWKDDCFASREVQPQG